MQNIDDFLLSPSPEDKPLTHLKTLIQPLL